jgi:hypothetical protein
MELLALLVMLAAGAALAIFILVAITITKGEERRNSERRAATDRDEIAASLLFAVLTAGGASPDESLRRLRRDAGVAARVTPAVDVTSWGESYARAATDAQRASLLELAVQLAAAREGPIPLRQYVALLDLSFALGFHIDALARLRERYGFDYNDHAKDARPREADRAGGATPMFLRDETATAEYMRVLEISGSPTRQMIIAAYRRLAAQNHPDKFFAAEAAQQERAAARFIEITRAYEKLLAIYRD